MKRLAICAAISCLYVWSEPHYIGFHWPAALRGTLALWFLALAVTARRLPVVVGYVAASLGVMAWSAGVFNPLPLAVSFGVLTLAVRGASRVKLPRIALPSKPRSASSSLDSPIFPWNKEDVYTRRDLHTSVAVFGQTGSGKTSSVLLLLMRAALKINSGGLLLASKPEDEQFYIQRFKEAGRLDDLIIFDDSGRHKFNATNFILESKGDAREITHFLTTLSAALGGEQGKGNDPYWAESQERLIFCAVVALMIGLGRVTVPELRDFILGAKQGHLTEEAEAEWKKGLHYKVMDDGARKPKSDRDGYDYDVAAKYFAKEWPNLDQKPRSSILSGVMNILHLLNTGMVRDLFSSETTVSPSDFRKGRWCLVNLPIDQHGQSGKVSMHIWKYMTQKDILRRHVTETDPTILIVADEAQDVFSDPSDGQFLAKCRSHYGGMIYLTQSIHSYFGEADGHAGEHRARGFMTNFGLKAAVTLGDPETASYLCSLMGQRLEGLTSYGDNKASFTESYQNALQPIHLLTGLRSSGGKVDGYVFRQGLPFRSTGENFLRVELSQD